MCEIVQLGEKEVARGWGVQHASSQCTAPLDHTGKVDASDRHRSLRGALGSESKGLGSEGSESSESSPAMYIIDM